jgi:hypothetical protein
MPTNNSWNSQDPVEVALGGTGANVFNTDGVVISNNISTGSLNALSLTNGQIVVGSSSGAPMATTITGGTGISVTNAANSITISSPTSITWVSVNTLVNALANHGYLCDCSAADFGIILPASPSVGDRYIIIIVNTGGGSNSVSIDFNTSQYIQFGNQRTSISTGYLMTTQLGDTVDIVYVGSNIFQVVSAVGNVSLN